MFSAFVGILVLNAVPRAGAQISDVTGEEVRAAIRNGVKAMLRAQRPEGRWPERYHPGGETCLATLALLLAGESPDSPAMQTALEYVRKIPNQRTYVVSLKAMALAQADPGKYRADIVDCARWLISAQNASGLWNYTPQGDRFDHSNAQFALLGLHAASSVGIQIPPNVWRAAERTVLQTQRADGGWAYQNDGASYGSMTAAGVSDLLILGNTFSAGLESGFRNGAAPRCGEYRTNRALAGGLSWLSRHFDVANNPMRGRNQVYYWLYAAERCGILSGQRHFGRREWYREGARFLVRGQRADGHWTGDQVDTCFAIMFLAKGHLPLLIQKLQWTDGDGWNLDQRDVPNLVSFIGDQLGQPVAWQSVRFDASLEDWLDAPILYLQGHAFPAFSAGQREKLRRYVEHGGTLLAEACCSRKEFQEGFEAFTRDVFPGTLLRVLGDEHSVYHVEFDTPSYGLMGIDMGCRTAVIFSPRDMSCLWEQGDRSKLGEQVFRIGANIAAYAVGRRPLRDRLDVVLVPENPPSLDAAIGGDALRLGQVVYDADWRPFPQSLVRLAEALRDDAGIEIVTRYQPVRLTDDALAAHPILYMAGHYDFRLSQAERDSLAAYLKRGGFVFADACCGPEPFGAAFRRLIGDLFADATLQKLPMDHAIFAGKPGFPISNVRYTPDLLRDRPDMRLPELWGLEIEGRLAVLFSPYGLGCGLSDLPPEGCTGLVADDARRIAVNVILYALTH